MAEEIKPAAPTSTAAPVTAPVTSVETKTYQSVDASASAKPAASGWDEFGRMMPMLAGMMLIFYFLLIRPEKKRREHQLAIVSAMKKGDKVILTNGIYGTVADTPEGDDVTVVIDAKKDVRMKVRKDAIGSILTDEKVK